MLGAHVVALLFYINKYIDPSTDRKLVQLLRINVFFQLFVNLAVDYMGPVLNPTNATVRTGGTEGIAIKVSGIFLKKKQNKHLTLHSITIQ